MARLPLPGDSAGTPKVSYAVREMPERLRPREEMERLGVKGISDVALLAIILRGGVQGQNVVRIAEELLLKHQTLTGIANAPQEDLLRIRGIGKVKAQVLAATLELAKRLIDEGVSTNTAVRTPEDAAGLLREEARTLSKEVFWVIMLDAKNRLKVPPQEVTQGLLDASLVHPREVFKKAILSSSAAVILAHNHPSGDPCPSAEDIRITRQLVEAGKIVDIKVLDHIILGNPEAHQQGGFTSMREAGVVEFK
ncbi:MAG: DNA repair protein RadC [bacterium]